MQKVLITGGSGFIGFHLADELSKKYKVDILDNFSRGKLDKDLSILIKKKNINLIEFDLKKIINLSNKDYDYIFHFAATIGVNNVINNPWEVLNNNFLSTKNIIEFARKQKNLKKFFFASTSEIYAGSLSAWILNFPTKESQLIAQKAAHRGTKLHKYLEDYLNNKLNLNLFEDNSSEFLMAQQIIENGLKNKLNEIWGIEENL